MNAYLGAPTEVYYIEDAMGRFLVRLAYGDRVHTYLVCDTVKAAEAISARIRAGYPMTKLSAAEPGSICRSGLDES